MDEDRLTTLADSGMKIAVRIYGRHKLLTDIQLTLGADAETARTDACKIEHDLSGRTFEVIRKRVQQ